MSNSPRDFALKFAKKGWQVLPIHTVTNTNESRHVCSCRDPDCNSPAKHPVARFAPQGLKNATSDSTLIREWFRWGIEYNIGIATGTTSGLVVLDIDTRHGGDATLQALEAKNGKLPNTLWWLTGGGGRHILFRHPGGTVPNSAGRLGAGIDVRGNGGYIVAPPSRHISGGNYYMPDASSLDQQLAALPPWLLKLMLHGANHHGSQSPRRSNGIGALVRSKVPEGQRNNSIASLTGYLLSKKIPPRTAFDIVLAFNEARCTPPLTAEEVLGIVSSIDHLSFTKLINQN